MKGYINIEFAGVKRGIKFGNRALLDVMAKHQTYDDKGNPNTDLKFSFDLIVDLVYFGMVNNCMISKQNIDFTEEEVLVWVDDLATPKLMEIFEVFQKSFSDQAEIVKPGNKVTAKKRTV